MINSQSRKSISKIKRIHRSNLVEISNLFQNSIKNATKTQGTVLVAFFYEEKNGIAKLKGESFLIGDEKKKAVISLLTKWTSR
jgi:hypothetical protein